MSELQRARLLDAAFAVVSEDGYRRMTARRVSGRAGVSNKTFYDLFSDREDCFLAAFDYAVEECSAVACPAYEVEKGWSERIRAGLGALLGFLDGEPELCRLLFVEALGAGPRVLVRRAEILGRLESVIDEGRTGGKSARPAQELPPLTAAGIVGAVFSVIHGQLVEQPRESLSVLLNPLMAMIVLPYRGRAAAARELARPISKAGPRTLPTLPQGLNHRGHGLLPADKSRHPSPPSRRDLIRGDSISGPAGRTSGSRAGFQLTIRTYAVLTAVAGHPGVSNREVSDLVRVSDQGQISRLMARLDEEGLVENAGGRIQGVAKSWRLTARGEGVVQANRLLGERAA